jgi:hypothetical protein
MCVIKGMPNGYLSLPDRRWIWKIMTAKYTISSDKLWKDHLNNNGQQFHQYQQNERPPLTSRININVIHMLEVTDLCQFYLIFRFAG